MANMGCGRREFLGAVGGSVIASALVPSHKSAALTISAKTNRAAGAATKPYGAQYYDKVTGIWDAISTSELPILAEAADQAAISLKNGGKLYCLIVGGHMHLGELRRARAGNPDYLHNWSRIVPPEKVASVGKGDFLLFDYPKPFIKEALDRGAFTVGLRVPYFPNQTTPKGVLAMNKLGTNRLFQDVLLPEECARATLTTHVPFTDGVLYVPEIPAVRVCGASPQGTFNLYWMLTAEIAMRHASRGAMGSTQKAQEFMEIIKKRGKEIRDSLDHIDAVATVMADSLKRGAHYWNYPVYGQDENSTLEQWSIMVEENTNRASGLVMSKLLIPDEIPAKAKAGDFVIIAGETSDVVENIAAAHAFKNAGLTVIYIGPKTEKSTGEDLSKIADWHIDTFSPERDGVLTIPGFEKKICPTTGVLYALAQNILNGQFIGHMIEANMVPLVYMGVHLIGGLAYKNVIEQVFEERGY